MNMKQLIWFCVFLSLVSISVGAAGTATLGLYFGYVPDRMAYSPQLWEEFKMFLYLHNADALVTGVEYTIARASTNSPFEIMDYSLPPQGVLEIGQPPYTNAIVFWPPLDGSTGYNLICEYTCLELRACRSDGGTVDNYYVRVVPNRESGALRGTYYPNNDFFPIVGLTSILCPSGCLGCIGTEKTTWGSIKSLFERN
jgi:hypothetical protein